MWIVWLPRMVHCERSPSVGVEWTGACSSDDRRRRGASKVIECHGGVLLVQSGKFGCQQVSSINGARSDEAGGLEKQTLALRSLAIELELSRPNADGAVRAGSLRLREQRRTRSDWCYEERVVTAVEQNDVQQSMRWYCLFKLWMQDCCIAW